ncbi:uncharacterized protein [Littorina saxatilis]|uniref:Peptidase M28 domain-containing protein n=1 Tax=Littorina saxatilis TaxID=31220 RepID=A0AAN9BT48_9CAEN
MSVNCFLFATILACQLTLCSCDGIDTVWMNTTLTQHFSQPRHHVTNPGYKQQTMTFIRDEFRAMGLDTHIHTFPTLLDNVTGVNVIGVLKGRHFNTPSDKIVGIGAHYDTMRNTPGVNDNGAAVVVMLQAARELSLHPVRNYTLLFVAFDFEEWEHSGEPLVACGEGMCGSRSLVSTWIPSFWTQPVGWRGIFVMDTILNFDHNTSSQRLSAGLGVAFPSQTQDIKSDGGRGDFLVIAGRGEDQTLLNGFNASWDHSGPSQFEVESFTLPMVSDAFGDFLRSDHYAFWLAGLKAVFITDSANFRGYMTACYHNPCDDIQRVTSDRLDFVTKTCRTLVSVLDKMAAPLDNDHQQNGSASCNNPDSPANDGALLVTASLTSLAIIVALAVCLHNP